MRNFVIMTALVGAVAAFLPRLASSAAATTVLTPAPVIDAPRATAPASETAILSGGCFWGMQLVFQHVKGVRGAVSGYTGGAADSAHYDDVSTGTTGQAESLKITFDPHVISYGQILRIYLSVAADPTELNYQGPDHGTQYRSVIWAENPQQRRIATAYLKQLAAAHTFTAPIVTAIHSAMPFYDAERYHQNYATLHPDSPYIATFDAPKLRALARLFPTLYTRQPRLVRVSALPVGAG